MKRQEIKIYGRHACRAVAQRRPTAILRAFVSEEQAREFGPMLSALSKARRPYRVVTGDELEAVTESRHHEGICLVAEAPDARRPSEVLGPPGPAIVLALVGVGNPHNIGAMLRTAAHFGARAVMISGGPKRLSAAAHRTAEGAAEWLDVIFPEDLEGALATCRDYGFTVCATSSHDGESLFDARLPGRIILLVGAEGQGLPARLMTSADRLLSIPGTGHVESLNVSSATAVVLADLARRH